MGQGNDFWVLPSALSGTFNCPESMTRPTSECFESDSLRVLLWQDLKMRLKGMANQLAIKKLHVVENEQWGDGIREDTRRRRGSLTRSSAGSFKLDATRNNSLTGGTSHLGGLGPAPWSTRREGVGGSDGIDNTPRSIGTPPSPNSASPSKSFRGSSTAISRPGSANFTPKGSSGANATPTGTPLKEPAETPVSRGTPLSKGGMMVNKMHLAKAKFDAKVASLKPQVYVKPETWADLVISGLKDRIMAEVWRERPPDTVEKASLATQVRKDRHCCDDDSLTS